MEQTIICLPFLAFCIWRNYFRRKINNGRQGRTVTPRYGIPSVRVRIHGTIARIEILPEEFPKLVEETNRNLITKSFKEYGFTYVTMDLTGYRTGSMNETLNSDFVPASTVSP